MNIQIGNNGTRMVYSNSSSITDIALSASGEIIDIYANIQSISMLQRYTCGGMDRLVLA